ncbi:TCP family transcription factor 4 [Actinidia rufa]|uniref:TCP family transcription factor 4 n=1 Tax=Actinidia rufa TaxID=165716 RepID=A0A7J0FZL6_9ERIC|nr:TCP family transcription factor 4 [Actinidia rufa]
MRDHAVLRGRVRQPCWGGRSRGGLGCHRTGWRCGRRGRRGGLSRLLGGADLAVAVFPAGGPDNVAALYLHDLAADVPQAQSRWCLTVMVGLFRFSLYMFDGFGSLLLHVLEKDLGSGFGFGEAEDVVEDGVDVDDEDGGGDSSEDPDSEPCFDFAVPTFD